MNDPTQKIGEASSSMTSLFSPRENQYKFKKKENIRKRSSLGKKMDLRWVWTFGKILLVVW